MFTRGIRGAITVKSNTIEDIKNATISLISEMIEKNNIKISDISHCIFTMTNDLDAAYPAKFARDELKFDFVPLLCFNELNIQNSLKMCLRALIIINTEKSQEEIKHIYLEGAKILRPDL
ncbi:MAG: chorismate mutase [Candidatus Melainabacteria bacterium LEY3_CP_29_8]|nr:MAG: chorismate mutase [Candidatus Melainabacteria bacterium LEY3_CP_29_8]